MGVKMLYVITRQTNQIEYFLKELHIQPTNKAIWITNIQKAKTFNSSHESACFLSTYFPGCDFYFTEVPSRKGWTSDIIVNPRGIWY